VISQCRGTSTHPTSPQQDLLGTTLFFSPTEGTPCPAGPRRRRDPLQLRNRGRRTVVLDTCERPCGAVQIGAGLASWASGASGHTYILATGKRTTWKFSRRIVLPVASLQIGAQQTASTIFFNLPKGSTVADGFRVYEAPAPHVSVLSSSRPAERVVHLPRIPPGSTRTTRRPHTAPFARGDHLA